MELARKKIIFVTGTRADFGKMEPLATSARDAGFDVSFFVTGMHMMAKYGLTKTEVHRAMGDDVVEFVNQREGDPQDIILAKTVVGFSDFLMEAQPNMVVIHGDRIEAIACALVCATNYILCAHVEGGEVSGTIDEVLRHCNTKLSSIHLVSSEEARKRILRLGEPPETVHVLGSPELDKHALDSGVTIEEVSRYYDIPFDSYGILIFHPVTSEQQTMGQQADALFSTIRRSKKPMVVIMPNNDPGSDDILRVINTLPGDQFRIIPSMRFNYFSELLKNAKLMVGNSSVGVREAPFLGVPSLDVGTRQYNRTTAPSVTTATAFEEENILDFLESNWDQTFNPYVGFGSGSAAEKFERLLLDEAFWSRPMQKFFSEEKSEG
jgi:UDP-N-acetylglucosamine 2-epimerase (hydrolysing)